MKKSFQTIFITFALILGLTQLATCQKPDPRTVTHPSLRETVPTGCRPDNAGNLLRNFKVANARKTTTKGPGSGGGGKPPRNNNSYSCILIDMDGQTGKWSNWNNGQTLTLSPPALTLLQKQQVVAEVAALFDRFNVTVTMDEAVYNAANYARRIRVIVTPTSAWYTGVTGVAYNGSFTWGTGVPAFVFSDRLYNGPHYIAEIVAHETGHTLGLRHQSEYWEENVPVCALKLTYRMGVVMGNSLYVPQGAWFVGTTYSCSVFQNDIAVMAGVLGLRY
jgi:hypothetical protein